VDVERLDEGQKWAAFVALRLLAVIGAVPPLRRVLAYFLVHCGLDLGSTLISALVGTSDRNVRYNHRHSAEELWRRVSHPIRGHRPPKLGPEHAGPVAKFLAANPRARVNTILQFIAEELGVEMDRLTLRRFIKRYGLGCLRGDEHEQGPLFWAQRPTGAPFS